MIDVVHRADVAAQLQDVTDGVEIIQGPQCHFRFGNVLIEFAIDAESAHLAEPIAVGVLELFAEEFLGLFELRRVAGPQPLVDLEQGLFVRRHFLVALGGLVFLQRSDDQHVEGLALIALDRQQRTDLRLLA